MSTLYDCKITQDSIIHPTGSEIVTIFPVHSDWWQDEYLFDGCKEPKDFADFREQIKNYIEEKGPQKALDSFYHTYFFPKNHYQHLINLLHGNLAEEVKEDDLHNLENYYFGHNLLAELMPSLFKLYPIRKVCIDVVTIHPDAGFPEGDSVLHLLNKDFCIRLLADAEGEHSKLSNWFNSKVAGSFYEYNFGGLGEAVYAMICGARRIDTIDLQVQSEDFWETHKDKWWHYLKNHLESDSDYKPYQAVSFEIYLHPSWLGNSLTGLQFDSAAYATCY
ncbi:MAG: hypothetical protein GY827_06540 [Cytophagales bacterium]|nr:hypothetical protein [Cytophagales bacterium]